MTTALPPTTYRTRITTQRHPTGTDPESVPAEGWRPGLPLTLAFSYAPGRSTPDQMVTLGGRKPALAITVSSDDVMRMTLGEPGDPDVLCELDDDPYLAATIDFSGLGDSFTGSVSATCLDRKGTGVYLWTGTADEPSAFVRAAVHRSGKRDLRPLGDALSLGELVGLVPDDSVRAEASQLLVESMKWALGQSSATRDWVRQFFGEQPPALAAARTALIEPDLAWYQGTLAVAYLARGLDDLPADGPPQRRLDAGQKGKLDTFLSKGLAQSPAYARQMEGLYSAAYVEAKPRLQAYLDDGGARWADELLDFATSQAQLDNFYNLASGPEPSDVRYAGALATLLHVLDPTAARAQAFARALLSYSLVRTSLETVVKDAAAAMRWMPEALQQFGRDSGGSGGDRQVVAAAVARAAQQSGGYPALAQQLVDLLVAAPGQSFLLQALDASKAFATSHPDLANAGRALFALTWAGGLYGVASAFVKADPGASLVGSIADCLALVGAVIDRVPAVLAPPSHDAESLAIVEACADSDVLDRFSRLVSGLVSPGTDWMAVGAGAMGELVSPDVGGIAAGGTPWMGIVNDTSKLLGGLVVISALGYTITSTATFIADLRSGKPVGKQAVDGIAASAYLAATVCAALDLALDAAILGTAASAFCYLGALAAIIAAFMPVPTPQSPLDVFMSEKAVPFVDALPGV